MPVSPLFALGFCLCAAILLTLVSVSAPTWDKIFFLDAGNANTTVYFGVLGFSGARVNLGYRFKPSSLKFNDKTLDTPLFRNLTRALILHPIAAGASGLAFLLGLCGVTFHRAGTVAMVLFAATASIVCLVAFLVDMVLFGIAHDTFNRQGFQSHYGNACWLTLAALVALLSGFSVAAYGVFARYQKRKSRSHLAG